MRILTYFILLFFSAKALPAQNSQLKGELKINMSKGLIEGSYELQGYQAWDGKLSFLLNDVFEVSNLRLNGEAVFYFSTGDDCYDCTIYSTPVYDIKESDKLSFDLKGQFQVVTKDSKTKPRDYKGIIAFNDGILRASEQSKWYPVLVDESNVGEVISFTKRKYDYDISVECVDCKAVYIGEGEPQNGVQSQFKSRQALDDIMLIAGDYEWSKEDNLVMINIPVQERKALAKAVESIMAYYSELTGQSIEQPFTVANCPSRVEWAFLTYPTIVFTRQDFKTKNAINTLSHEIAHYYFGNLYEPKSNLFWFYLESFAEYFSNKYQIKTGKVASLKNDYRNLKSLAKIQWIPFFNSWKGNKINFVKLNKVKKVKQVHVAQRYLISPFQLLGIEQEIGESKMMEWIALVFSKIEDGKDGYAPMLESFEAIGLSKGKIKGIEKRYFKKLRGDVYNFVDKL